MGQPSDLLPPDALSSAFSALWRLFWVKNEDIGLKNTYFWNFISVSPFSFQQKDRKDRK
jgi:hypothetical protein